MITYQNIFGVPDDAVLNGVLALHQQIFKDSTTLVAKMTTKPNLLVTIALDHADNPDGSAIVQQAGTQAGIEIGTQAYTNPTGHNGSRQTGAAVSSSETYPTCPSMVGYKIGYELDSEKFYSWLGGVDANYRNQGIASQLMEVQHNYLRQSGYRFVETKTKNKWRNMLILNIKHRFDVVGTYTDETGEPKIILKKSLLD